MTTMCNPTLAQGQYNVRTVCPCLALEHKKIIRRLLLTAASKIWVHLNKSGMIKLTKCGGSIKPHTNNRSPYPIHIGEALGVRHLQSTAANWFYTSNVLLLEGLVTRDPRV